MSFITGFYGILTGLYALLPSVICQLILAIVGTYVLFGLIKMFR